MTSYKKRKLLRQIKQHSNAIVYSVIFMTATAMTITAATDRIKKTEYIEAAAEYSVENSVDIEDSTVKRVANTEDATEAVTETTTEAVEETTAQETETESSNSEYADKFIMNTTGTLNVRKSASTDAEIVGKLEEGAGGTVLEKGDEWTKIQSGELVGYVATQYILIGDAAADKIDKATVYTATVNADTLNVRAKKSTDSSILGMIANGEKYTVVSQTAEWVEISFEGRTGYVSKEFVKIEQSMKTGKTMDTINAEAAKKLAEKESQAKAEEESRVAESQAAAEAESARQAAEAAKNTVSTDAATAASVDDTYLLACLVFCEAGGESYEGKLAVANVVLNRVKAGWGSSIKDVIYAPGQFGPASNGALSRALKNGADSSSTKAAKAALAGNNNVSGLYYFAPTGSVNTGNLGTYKIIGSHIFY